MKFCLFSLLCIMLLVSCNPQSKNEATSSHLTDSTFTDSASINQGNEHFGISEFIAHSESPLLASARSSGDSIWYLFNGTDKREGRTYWMYKVGHTVKDSGGVNPRFVADAWVYIDTISGKLYEFDIAEEKLKTWEKP